MATLCPSVLAALAHDSPPGENQLSSLSFSERHLKLERYLGKWLQHGWPNRRDQEWRRRRRQRRDDVEFVMRTAGEKERGNERKIYHSYREDCRRRAAVLLFLERVIDPPENQLSPRMALSGVFLPGLQN